jgi:hypothetical protein
MNDFEDKINQVKSVAPYISGFYYNESVAYNYKRSIIDDYLKEHFDLSLKELQELIEKYKPERLI